MKIEYKREFMVPFDKLESGTVFNYEGDLYMKVTGVCTQNAVDVVSGELFTFDDLKYVIAVDGAFVVDEK